MQLTHYNTNFKRRIFPITLVCDHVTNAPNLGGLFRIADTFGVEKLILCGKNIPLGRKMTKTSRATEKFVSYEVFDSVLKVVQDLKSKEYQIISLEITENSEPLDTFKFSTQKPIALIIGNENFGVSEAI